MARSLVSALRRLAHPRSQRSALWASVYCGAFDVDAARADGGRPVDDAERPD